MSKLTEEFLAEFVTWPAEKQEEAFQFALAWTINMLAKRIEREIEEHAATITVCQPKQLEDNGSV